MEAKNRWVCPECHQLNTVFESHCAYCHSTKTKVVYQKRKPLVWVEDEN